MKSLRNRRSTRRNRKNRNRNRTRRGGGWGSSRIKTFVDNVGLCNKSSIGAKQFSSCDNLAKQYNFFKEGMMGDIRFKDFYPKDLSYNTKIDATELRGPKKRRYEQIGHILLPKYDSTGKTIGYVLKDTPLSYDEVSSFATPEELEEYINGMKEITDTDVNKLFEDRSIKI